MIQADSLTQLVPSPEKIHRRLGDLVREQKLLRKALRLALDMREEQERRQQSEPNCREVAHAG